MEKGNCFVLFFFKAEIEVGWGLQGMLEVEKAIMHLDKLKNWQVW